MSSQVRSTKNYELFELHEFNRNVRSTKQLEESMRRHGWIDAYPMHVVMNGGGKFRIKGGHHRFIAAQKVGIPVKYIVCNDNGVTIHELEKATSRWKIDDYLESFCRCGKEDYITLKKYFKMTGIPLNSCIAMFSGEQAGSSNKVDEFKAGKFHIVSSKHANEVARIVLHCKKIGVECAASQLFVHAISKVLFVKEFSSSIFMHKAEKFKALLIKQTTVASYLDMIEDVYNRSSRSKVPLSFLADEAAKARNPIGRSK